MRLFGAEHLVIDHPLIVDRLDTESDKIQIVHVHGTSDYYDCCNLRGEILDRSRKPVRSHTTMGSALDAILRRRSPIVIGYSGWEGDVIMAAIEHRLISRPPHNFYWFCHRDEDMERLPGWLQSHPNVSFVLPEIHRLSVDSHVSVAPIVGAPWTGQSASDTETLSAVEVFECFIRELKIPEPAVTSNPADFIKERITDWLPIRDDEIPGNRKIYFLQDLHNFLDRLIKDDEKRDRLDELELEILSSIRVSNYKSALKKAMKLWEETENEKGLDNNKFAAKAQTAVDAAWTTMMSLKQSIAAPEVGDGTPDRSEIDESLKLIQAISDYFEAKNVEAPTSELADKVIYFRRKIVEARILRYTLRFEDIKCSLDAIRGVHRKHPWHDRPELSTLTEEAKKLVQEFKALNGQIHQWRSDLNQILNLIWSKLNIQAIEFFLANNVSGSVPYPSEIVDFFNRRVRNMHEAAARQYKVKNENRGKMRLSDVHDSIAVPECYKGKLVDALLEAKSELCLAVKTETHHEPTVLAIPRPADGMTMGHPIEVHSNRM